MLLIKGDSSGKSQLNGPAGLWLPHRMPPGFPLRRPSPALPKFMSSPAGQLAKEAGLPPWLLWPAGEYSLLF